MTKIILTISLILIFISCANSLGGTSGRSFYSKSNPYPNYSKSRLLVGSEQNVPQTKKASPTSRGLGLSAWGLVFIVVSMILTGVGAYYMTIFYPLLCKKERNYDRIELSPV